MLKYSAVPCLCLTRSLNSRAVSCHPQPFSLRLYSLMLSLVLGSLTDHGARTNWNKSCPAESDSFQVTGGKGWSAPRKAPRQDRCYSHNKVSVFLPLAQALNLLPRWSTHGYSSGLPSGSLGQVENHGIPIDPHKVSKVWDTAKQNAWDFTAKA